MKTNGTPAWLESKAGQKLQQSLSEEKVLNGINHLLLRIGTLENAVEKLTSIMEQGPGMLSMVTDMVDAEYKRTAERGIDLEQRLGNALHIAEKLTAPEMMEKLDKLINLADLAPGLGSMAVDVIDEEIKLAADKGIDLNQRLNNALVMAEKLTAPKMMEKLDYLIKLSDLAPGLVAMAIDILDEEHQKAALNGFDLDTFVELATDVVTSVAKAKEMPKAKVGGFWSMLKTMRDPDRQKAIGFVMNIAKAFGEQLNKQSNHKNH